MADNASPIHAEQDGLLAIDTGFETGFQFTIGRVRGIDKWTLRQASDESRFRQVNFLSRNPKQSLGRCFNSGNILAFVITTKRSNIEISCQNGVFTEVIVQTPGQHNFGSLTLKGCLRI